MPLIADPVRKVYEMRILPDVHGYAFLRLSVQPFDVLGELLQERIAFDRKLRIKKSSSF